MEHNMMLVFTSKADARAAQAAIASAMNFPTPVNAATKEPEPYVARTNAWATPINRYDDNSLWYFPKPPKPAHMATIPSSIQYTEEAFDASWAPPPPPDDQV